MHLTGQAAQAVDQQAQQSKTQTLTEILSVIFILLLLLLTFRALLAPFVALLPSGVALIAVQPVIAASAHIGVQVSDLTPVLLVVVLLGAGTDYGLFLIFRVREEIRRGLEPRDAVAFCSGQGGRIDHLLGAHGDGRPVHRGLRPPSGSTRGSDRRWPSVSPWRCSPT